MLLNDSLLNALRTVHWHDAGTQSPLFQKLGVTHGFYGVREDTASLTCHNIRQVQGKTIIEANPATAFDVASEQRPAADGIFTTVKSQSVAIRAADCLPVLFCSSEHTVVAAVHAGWRGLTAGILSVAVQQLQTICAVETIYAAIGPAISLSQFEVGPEVVEAVMSPALGLTPAQAALAIAKGRGDRWHVDLSLAAVLTLINAGLKPEHISVMQSCTKLDPRWHSYRRDSIEGKKVPSNWSWVQL